MGFQTTVSLVSGAGVVGEFYTDSPRRVQSFIIDSVSAANNIFGRGFSKTSTQGVAQAGNPGGTGVFAGFLVNPKAASSNGGGTGPLSPTLTLPDYSQGELASMGSIWVTLPGAAAIGDLVLYDNTTGALTTIAPGADLPVGKSFAHAVVDFFTVSGAGLAVVTITDVPVTPVLATP